MIDFSRHFLSLVYRWSVNYAQANISFWFWRILDKTPGDQLIGLAKQRLVVLVCVIYSVVPSLVFLDSILNRGQDERCNITLGLGRILVVAKQLEISDIYAPKYFTNHYLVRSPVFRTSRYDIDRNLTLVEIASEKASLIQSRLTNPGDIW